MSMIRSDDSQFAAGAALGLTVIAVGVCLALTKPNAQAFDRDSGPSVTAIATVSAADHELADDPAALNFVAVRIDGGDEAPFTLLVRRGKLKEFLANVNGRRVHVTVWAVPK